MSNEFTYFIDSLISNLVNLKAQLDECKDNDDRAELLRMKNRIFTYIVIENKAEITRLKKFTHLKALMDLLLHMYENKLFDCCDVLNKLDLGG